MSAAWSELPDTFDAALDANARKIPYSMQGVETVLALFSSLTRTVRTRFEVFALDKLPERCTPGSGDPVELARASDGEHVARLILNPAEARVYVTTQRVH